MIKNLQLSKTLLFCAFTFLFLKGISQEWTWVKGTNIYGAYGVYGTQGTAAASNMPGSREAGATWTDASGNLWLFGGNGNCSFSYGRLNDLWKFDVSTQNWTWVKGADIVNQTGTYGTLGTASVSNIPGGRAHAVSWIDNSGNLWLFGGQGYDSNGYNDNLNDLWKYNTSTNQWTWMGGSNNINQPGAYGTQAVASSTNIPGARRLSTGWKDGSGNLWLFGGYGFDAFGTQSNLNDLWKYNPSGNTWTWIKGSNATDQYGTYGTLGTAGSSNAPGARQGMRSWKDNAGNLWMFSGSGQGSSTSGFLNDIWKFNTSTSQWTWMKGSDVSGQSMSPGQQTVPSSTATPGGRYLPALWCDNYDNMFVFGGYGFSANGPQQLNDTWKFNCTTSQWTYVRGNTINEVVGSYGTQGVTSSNSDPGSGNSRMYWKDGSANFWLFGGSAYDVNANFSIENELWKMNPCVAPAPINLSTFTPQNPCTGSSATLSAMSNTNVINWYATPSGTTSLGTGTTYVTSALNSGTATTASFTYYASSTNTCGASAARTPIVVTSNSIYPLVTTGTVYTVNLVIPDGQTPNSSFSPWIYSFTDPVPAGGIIIGMDMTCDVVDQGWGGSGVAAVMEIAEQNIGSPVLSHNVESKSMVFTGAFSNYVYGGSNDFKMFFAGWSGWQGFLSNANIIIRYQTKPSLPVNVCQNSNYLIKGYGAETYSWTSGLADNVTYTPSVSQNYTVTGYNKYGCANTTVLQLSVTPAPTVTIPGNITVCGATTVVQTATVTGSIHTFSWSTGATSYSLSATPTLSTRYTAVAINTLTGCSHQVSRKVTINSAPSATVSASNNNFCPGQSTSLSLSGSGNSYALNLDGNDDYIETNASLTELGKGSFCIEAWIKTTATNQGIVTCENSNYSWDSGEKSFYIDGYGIPNFIGYNNDFILGDVAVNDGQWHHVAVSWTYSTGATGTGKIYVDGVDHTSSSTNFHADTYNLGTFKIGATTNGSEVPNNFSGTIDDVRIWNTTRSSSQIAANMNVCLAGNEAGLVGYYNMENGAGGSEIADESTNGYTGSLTNMSATAWVTGKGNCVNAFVSYAWLPGGSTTSSVTVSPATSTTYSVIITNASSCSVTALKTVSVYPIPVISLNNGTICAGANFTITPSGANSYTFINGASVVNPTATTSYSVIGNSSQGCLSALPGISTILVNALPVLNISGPNAVCSGSTVSQIVSGATSYSWSTGSTASSISVNPTLTTLYNVSGTNTATGCSNTTSKTLVIGNSPVITVNSGNVCAGSTFTLMPSGASTYTFSNGPSLVSSVVSPSANTTYYISGTSTLGCVSTNSAISNIIVNAAPVIAVNSGGICAGKVFTMTPTGASTYTFSNGSPTVAPGSTTSYSVTGTNVLGCISTIAAISNVTVNPIPVVAISNGTVCAGNNFSISPSGASNYTIISASGPSSAWVTPLTNANYSITGTSAQGCVASNTVVMTVSVIALPVISINNSTVCAGTIFTLVPAGASTYSYSSGSSTVIPVSNTSYSITGTSSAGCVSSNAAVAVVTTIAPPVVTVNSGFICSGNIFSMVPSGAVSYSYSGNSSTVSPTTNTFYTVTGTNSLGCVSANAAIANVVVFALPAVSVIGNSVICKGESSNLIATGANSYTWTNMGTNFNQIVTPLVNTIYTVSGSDSHNCKNTSTVQIVVNALPILSLNTGSVCPSGTFVLTPSGAINYTYSSGSNVITPVLTSTYSVIGTDLNGCTSNVPAITTVTVLNNVAISVSGTSVICAGETASLSVSGANTYTWSNGQSTSVMVQTLSANSTYTVIGADGTCADTAFISVQVNQLPTMLVNSSSAMLCLSQTATLTSSGATSYLWQGGEAEAVIVINPSVTTMYTVTGTDLNGCSDKITFTQNVGDCLGIGSSKTNLSSFLNLYPNPNNGEFTVETSQDLTMTVVNTLGQVVTKKQLTEGNNRISLEDQVKGIYFIEFKKDNQAKTLKVIKQ